MSEEPVEGVEQTAGAGPEGADGVAGAGGGTYTEEDVWALREAWERERGEVVQEAVAPHEARVVELEAALELLRQEQWLGETLREASARAGVEISSADERLAGSDPLDRAGYQARLEALVAEEVAKHEGAAKVAALEAKVAELEAQLAHPRRDTFDMGVTRSGMVALEGLSPSEKIRYALDGR